MKRAITAVTSILFSLFLVGAALADPKNGGSPVDQLAIQRQLILYADSLDWPRGPTWPNPDAAYFNANDPTTWPESWEAGTKQFYSIFTDDAVVDYPSFNFRFVGKDNRPPAWNGQAMEGGIGYMFNGWNMASQVTSHTILSNIIVTVKGDRATSKDRFSHYGHLTRNDGTWKTISYTAGFHEGKWRKENGVWRCYYWRGTVQIDNAR